MARRLSLSEKLRRAVDASGLSRERICRMTGVDRAAMSRFMRGQRAIGTDSADKLAYFLKLDVVGPVLGTAPKRVPRRQIGKRAPRKRKPKLTIM